MARNCPNCREPVSWWRAFRTPAWGRFTCDICSSILGISLGRRITIVCFWVAIYIGAMAYFGLHRYGPLVQYGSMVASMAVVFYFLDSIILLERRMFTCRECGYDLHGLTDTRCPECGATFDPDEELRIDIISKTRPPSPPHRSAAILLLVLLVTGVVSGLVAWWQAARTPTRPPPASPPITTTYGNL